LYALLGLLVAFLGYRMVRPLNIFVVSEAFERPIPVTNPPRALRSLSASECARCHAEIYQEWSASMHAQAWADPYFQVDFAFDGSQQICRNCHTPLQNQQEHLVLGFRDTEKWKPILAPNEAFDRDLQAEGVTCAVCHVRGETIIGPYGDTGAPHPTRRDPAMTDGFGACTRCHVASGNRWDTFYRIPPCGTVAEINEAGTAANCTSCHMPSVVRPAWNGGIPRPGRQHLWKGGHDPATVRQALEVELDVGDAGETTGRRATLTLTNVGADHYLPTGTPDRHLTVDFRLKNAGGEVLESRRHVLKRTILWRPFIVDLRDTRLPKGAPRTYVFDFRISSEPRPAALEVVIRYHLLDEPRRKRIGYDNGEPISTVLYRRQVDLD
ncbi:MAG: hypothetical protein HY704_05620, partial [Gemmatimonadetes bacterium]|nr:hypothetical protein [Gemmatimonadota bacterium]